MPKTTRLLLAGAVALIGCAAEDPPPEQAVASADLTTVEASEATRTELGIARWTVALAGDHTTNVRGLDASNAQVVQVTQRATEVGGLKQFAATVTSGGTETRIEVEVDAASTRILANTFQANKNARRVVDRIISDFAAAKETPALSAGSNSAGVGPRSLAPLADVALTGELQCLVTCPPALANAAWSGAQAIPACQAPDGDCTNAVGLAANSSQGAAGSCSPAIGRGQEWVDAKIPYGGMNNGYRTDCSGFVSWAWGLPAPGRATGGFAPFNEDVSVPINVDDLAPGDALNSSGHIMLFNGWANPERTSINVMEEYQTGRTAEARPHVVMKTGGNAIRINGTVYTAIRQKRDCGPNP